MKICFAVCEYNPLHNGHLKHMELMKRETLPDATVIIMSGNFTQRGEPAIMHKLTRARHAILAGADAVFELPAVFATANAEIFAKGAVKLIKALPGVKALCFGAETGTANDFMSAARALSDESKEFKKALKSQLNEGFSLAKAKMNALASIGMESEIELLKNPNSILGVEYARAVLELEADIDICPVRREGAGFKDENLYGEISSAAAIRRAVAEGKTKKAKADMPPYVYADLPDKLPDAGPLTMYALTAADKKTLGNILDCTEGLENRLKSCAKDSLTVEELKQKIATKRYTAARISRILSAALLGIDERLIRKCQKSDLYLNVLAVKKGSEELLSFFRQNCKIPLITRKNDVNLLSGAALECFKKDVLANDVYSLLTGVKTNEFAMIKV